MSRIPAFALLLLGIFAVACAQNHGQGGDVSSDELSLKFKWTFQKGETTGRRASIASIPKAPPVPNGFTLIDGRSYAVRSAAIGSEPVVILSGLPGSKTEFGSIRILELEKNELSPSGYEWRDCTMLPRSIEELRPLVEPHAIEYVQAYNREMAKYFPDFALRKVACSPRMYKGGGEDLYLLAGRQIQPHPSPFTEIKLNLERFEAKDDGSWHFAATITNAGKKDATEINLRSIFAANISDVSVRPSQGKCGSSTQGFGSAVCHFGPLAAGRSATIELIVSPKPAADPNYSDVSKGPWLIEGYAKERAADPHWFATYFDFEPLKDQK